MVISDNFQQTFIEVIDMQIDMETTMDQEIREAFQTVFKKLDDLPCGDRGEQLARMDQKLKNGDTQKKSRVELWKVWMSLAALIVVVVQVVDKFIMK